jgi:hypothetical protein
MPSSTADFGPAGGTLQSAVAPPLGSGVCSSVSSGLKEGDVSEQQPYLISYIALRRAVGVLGICLPLLVTVGGKVFGDFVCQSSISAYFHTNVREVFVGVLSAVGVFLISYKGFDVHDDRASDIAGVAALGVAAFPCKSELAGQRIGILQLSQTVSNSVHVICAAVLFVTLAIISAFLFTKTASSSTMTPQKRARNRVYRICALVMGAALIEIAVFALVLSDAQQSVARTTLLGETVALIAFGVSWLVKGETILKDQPNAPAGWGGDNAEEARPTSPENRGKITSASSRSSTIVQGSATAPGAADFLRE